MPAQITEIARSHLGSNDISGVVPEHLASVNPALLYVWNYMIDDPTQLPPPLNLTTNNLA